MPVDLDDASAHIWFADTETRDPDLLATYRELISKAERERIGRFRFEVDRHTALLTRAHLRILLSRYAPIDPRAWEFELNPHGRPFISAPRQARHLCFNLSHTRGLIGFVVARDLEVGIDVEDTECRDAPLASAADFFSPREVKALASLPESERSKRFFELWTLKESYLKARGVGLTVDLHTFSFEVDQPTGIGLHLDSIVDDDPMTWQFALLRPTPRHQAAVAIRRGPSRHDLTLVSRRL